MGGFLHTVASLQSQEMIDPQVRLGRNAFWMILSRFSAQGLAVVFTILLARRFGGAGFGEYAFIATVIFVANALTSFGTDMLLIREIAAKDDFSRLSAALVLQLVLSAFVIVGVWMVSAWIPNQSRETITALKIYSFALVPLAFFTIFTTVLRGVQRLDAYTLLNLIVSTMQVGVVLSSNTSIIELSIFLLSVQILAAAIAGFVCAVTLPHFWRVWRFSSIQLFSLIKQTAPLAWLTLLGMIYQRVNIYLLSTMSGATATGMCSAAFRMVEASKTMHLAVFAALYPALAQGQADTIHQGRWSEVFKVSWKVLLAGATIIAIVLFILAKPLVTLLYGREFTASTTVLQILAWMLIPFTINTYLTLSFLTSNRERLIGRAMTVSLIGLLILNLWWIPAQGPVGSAWAALSAECIQSASLLAGAGSRVHLQGEVHEFSELS